MSRWKRTFYSGHKQSRLMLSKERGHLLSSPSPCPCEFSLSLLPVLPITLSSWTGTLQPRKGLCTSHYLTMFHCWDPVSFPPPHILYPSTAETETRWFQRLITSAQWLLYTLYSTPSTVPTVEKHLGPLKPCGMTWIVKTSPQNDGTLMDLIVSTVLKKKNLPLDSKWSARFVKKIEIWREPAPPILVDSPRKLYYLTPRVSITGREFPTGKFQVHNLLPNS